MKALLNWLDHRTGYRQMVREGLYERIPGGSRWRYVWGSTLTFAIVVQFITGIVLWMFYSPSAQTAWESVFHIQEQAPGGWILRGIHHWMAQVMTVLLLLHLLQVVIDGAYRAPREINFWFGMFLLGLTLAMSLTGYLLPWDQKGYWASKVATNLMAGVPFIGDALQRTVVGGSDYGHHTLTRFFALHAGVLPALLIGLIIGHIYLFRRHGITAKQPYKKRDAYFWPDQILKDAVACLAVLAVVLVFVFWKRGAELTAPANPGEQYSAARPDWYFMFLFQFLKYQTMFDGWPGGAALWASIIVPGAAFGFFMILPFIGAMKWKVPAINYLLCCVFKAAAAYFLTVVLRPHFPQLAGKEAIVAGVVFGLALLPMLFGALKWRLPIIHRTLGDCSSILVLYAGIFAFVVLTAIAFQHDASDPHYAIAVKQAHADAERTKHLAKISGGIPPEGALALLRDDPKTQGPRIFKSHCASCHTHGGQDGMGGLVEKPAAADLQGFASRQWLTEFLSPDHIKTAKYWGNTAFVKPKEGQKESKMVAQVVNDIAGYGDQEKKDLADLIIGLSSQAKLKSQAKDDEKDAAVVAKLPDLIGSDGLSCTDCHKFGDDGKRPDLTGYGSRQWLLDFVKDPAHERFYGDRNDRMPSYGGGAGADGKAKPAKLTDKEIGLVVDWLRGEWRE